jgi:hypothetical protein
MKTFRQIQRFKTLKRRELIRRRSKGRLQKTGFTLAVLNQVKRQPLDVSRVIISEYEISPDT